MAFTIIITTFNQIEKDVDKLKDSFFESMTKIIVEKSELYSDFIFGMIVATFLWLIYHRFIGLKYVKKSYELRLDSKEETIKSLKHLVYEKLDRIDTPADMNKGILAKLKKTFNIK